MARLETQINQIYLVHPESKKTSLILYEEAVSSSLHLFVLAQLSDLAKKNESRDLKKISEIILESFRQNKKLPPEDLFESSLAQINQNLADLAHEGRKAWVGKFSCLIALKSADSIFLANSGQTAAWLSRKGEILEILPMEKNSAHPLKTFVNFTQGKFQQVDRLILSTCNIFNYLSFELFAKLVNQEVLEKGCLEISKILKESLEPDLGFCAFLLEFSKTPVPSPEPEYITNYAPLPEEIEKEEKNKISFSKFAVFSKIPKLFKMPKLGFKLPRFSLFSNLSLSGKFFFISFLLFLVISGIKVGSLAIQSHGKKTAEKIDSLIALVNKDLGEAQSALIYQDDAQAMELMAKTLVDFGELKKLNQAKASELEGKIKVVNDQVNKISVINDPKLFFEPKHHPTFLAKVGNLFLLGNQDSNSLSWFDGKLNDYFMLNSVKSPITAITAFSPAGTVVSAGNTIYRIDGKLKQFEQVITLSGSLEKMKIFSSNVFAFDSGGKQILKVAYSKNKYSSQKVATTKDGLRDFAADKDIYLLYADRLAKASGNSETEVKLPALTDKITNAERVVIGGNIFILEPNKKRLIIFTKAGKLLNQLYFPSLSNIFDFAVDEGSRNIFLLDDNKVYKITF